VRMNRRNKDDESEHEVDEDENVAGSRAGKDGEDDGTYVGRTGSDDSIDAGQTGGGSPRSAGPVAMARFDSVALHRSGGWT
jgi:hypothetical protein